MATALAPNRLEKGITVDLICDSLAPSGYRLTTWVLKYPRFIHAELMTHRQFSRNSSSSRAIPVKKLIQKVIDDPAMPVHWGKNQRGMQAFEELDDFGQRYAEEAWFAARDFAVERAEQLRLLGCHKQVVNRIIEPWMHIEVILSTTTLSNWFRLRDHKDAQPEIALLARKMRETLEEAAPQELAVGEWHIPFIAEEELGLPTEEKLKLSTARCARVSYLTHDGKRDPERDKKLHDHLVVQQPKHASPTEHQAMALSQPEQWGNFTGWVQYRKTLEDECAPLETYRRN